MLFRVQKSRARFFQMLMSDSDVCTVASNFITSVVCFVQEATVWLEWGKGTILKMNPGFVGVKVMYSSVREVEKCGVRKAEIWGNKKKSLWLRQSSGASWVVCYVCSVVVFLQEALKWLTVPRWLLRLCVVAGLSTCIHLQICRTASELGGS